ncbi:MAG: hypothetical protein WKG06_28665 [Segetibacter sp.]
MSELTFNYYPQFFTATFFECPPEQTGREAPTGNDSMKQIIIIGSSKNINVQQLFILKLKAICLL